MGFNIAYYAIPAVLSVTWKRIKYPVDWPTFSDCDCQQDHTDSTVVCHNHTCSGEHMLSHA